MNIASTHQSTRAVQALPKYVKSDTSAPKLDTNDTISIGAHVVGGALLGSIPLVNAASHAHLMANTPDNKVGSAANVLGMATIGAGIATMAAVVSEFSPWVLVAPAAMGGLHAGLVAYSRTKAGQWQG